MKTICGHCNQEYELAQSHDCEPNCIHCGATYIDLEKPEYDSAKIAVSKHERECSKRPDSWGKPFVDPEGQFRAERREQKRDQQWEEKRRKQGYVW